MTDAFDPANDGAQMEFDGRMSYGDYLGLDQVLSARQQGFVLHPNKLGFELISDNWTHARVTEYFTATDINFIM